MGKPYQVEITQLPLTYQWSITADIRDLCAVVTTGGTGPLIIVGSGGSLSVAQLIATVHMYYTSQVATIMTPLEVQESDQPLVGATYLFISASGSNNDIIDAFQHVVAIEPRLLTVMIAQTGSRLSKKASRYSRVSLVEFDAPSGRDGFLATNSLLAFTVLFLRAYADCFERAIQLPAELGSLPTIKSLGKNWQDQLKGKCSQLWRRENLIILHSPLLRSFGLDMESRFTEAALGHTQLADFRHFGHGRHHWLAKRPQQSAILALYTDDDADLARRTLQLIPEGIPKVSIQVRGTIPEKLIASMTLPILIAGFAGDELGIDPGRPGVPAFGRSLYHLRKQQGRVAPPVSLPEQAVSRKSRVAGEWPQSRASRRYWHRKLQLFIKAMESKQFSGLVCDYDGTVTSPQLPIDDESSTTPERLIELLNKQIPVGIATGRGQSIRKELRSIIPSHLWPLVSIGYYN